MLAKGMGSWRFIIIQTLLVSIWMILNLVLCKTLGCLSFYLAQLAFSTQAACRTNHYDVSKQTKRRDRARKADYQTNIDAKLEIEALTSKLNSIEVDKLDKIIILLQQLDDIKNKNSRYCYSY
jgi:uncharacterized membrane protein